MRHGEFGLVVATSVAIPLVPQNIEESSYVSPEMKWWGISFAQWCMATLI